MKIKLIINILLVSMLLASCAPGTAVPAVTATATSTTAPTTPTVTPTPVTYLPGLSTNVPEPDAAFIQQVVSENYLSVMGLTRDQVILSYHEHTDVAGMPYVVMVDESTGVPLAVYTDGNWQKAKLKFFGRQNGIVMGTDTCASEIVDAQVLQVMSEFDRATIQVGNEWESNEPTPENYNMDYTQQIERVVKYLKEVGITEIVAHPLTTAGHASWIDGSYTKDELREIMSRRAEFFMDNNPEADFIVVVNEPNLLGASLEGRQEDIFFKTWGNSDYVIEFFKTARVIDPKINLIFNDTDNHRNDGATTDATRDIVKILHEKDLVDYVGMQMHLNQWSGVQNGVVDTNTILEQIEYYRKSGVPVLFTEVTYEPTDTELQMDSKEFNSRLALIFEQITQVAIQSGNVFGITFWGVTDKYIKDMNWYQIFDENGQPKQAYYVVLRTLYEEIN